MAGSVVVVATVHGSLGQLPWDCGDCGQELQRGIMKGQSGGDAMAGRCGRRACGERCGGRYGRRAV